ncbi:MAG: UV DNA damage repair endonuclease UvsE [Deltaproteobacteria bacterium]|jgi:UV DNA damage endonuclease|nr:UV DNA damage repair endonuclease UvsE [Deltaproteobacteria bacterium]
MIRWGLCCLFREAPIKFRRTTAKYLSTLSPGKRSGYLSAICLHNAQSLLEALKFCRLNGIFAFRINSQILPLKTHPQLGYDIESLPRASEILDAFKKCGTYCRKHNLRTSFHPDQFILLSSPNPDVTNRSIAELHYQAEVARWVNADVINIHAGGAYGDKGRTLKCLVRRIRRLPLKIRRRLTLENDDRMYTPRDLLPVCEESGIPFVYDLHHHRCLPDGRGVEETTAQALKTWEREPLFHISSPLKSWKDPNPRNHHDYIDRRDFPESWLSLDITVDVEAKAKELAVFRLWKDLGLEPLV